MLQILETIKPMTIILIGAIIAIIGGLIGAVGTWLHNKQSSEKSTRTLQNTTELLKENTNLKEKVDSQSNKIDELRDENTQLYKDLLSKSEELNKFLGGSDAYPILLVNSMNSKNGESGFIFRITNEFDYPVYDIEINVFDFQKVIENSVFEQGKYVIKKQDWDKSLLFQNDRSHIAAKSEIITKEVFNIHDGILYAQIKCRSVFVFEKIAFVRIGNFVHHGFMIYDENRNTLKKWYGDNPTNEIKSKFEEKFNLIPKNFEFKFIN